MGVATQVTDLSDLRTDLLNRMREATGVTATNNIADRYINLALHDMHIAPGNNFPWAIRNADLLTHDDYTTGTVTISTSTRTTVTGSGTAWNTGVTGMGFNNARAGGKMTFAGGTDVYEVSTVDSDTQITLATRFVGSSGVAAGSSYVYMEDEYALAADFFRPEDVTFFDIAQEIRLLGAKEFRYRFPRNNLRGKPRHACLIQKDFGSDTTPRYRIVFHPVPDAQYLIRYRYLTTYLAVTSAGADQTQLTATTDEPIIPLRYRHALVAKAAEIWLRYRHDDARAREAAAEYQQIMTRVAGDTWSGQDRPRLAPRVGQYYGAVGRSRWRRQRFDVGGRFDELRD